MQNIDIISSLLNLNLVNIKYDQDSNSYYIYFKDERNHSFSLEHIGSGSQDIFSISFHSKKGIKKLYDVFPSADKIDFVRDKALVNKFRFFNTYLTGDDFNLKTNKLEDYISSDTYKNEHFIRNGYINSDDSLEFCIIYDYFISINDKSIGSSPYFYYKNTKFYESNFLDIDAENNNVNFLLSTILNEQAKKIDKKIEELKLIDSNLLQILNFN